MPHIHEKIDYCVEVFIVYKNKVLLRMHDKYKIWLSVGGHIELDEDPIQAAIREVKEEVGLDVKIIDDRSLPNNESDYKMLVAPRYLGSHYVNDVHKHTIFVFFVKSNTDKILDSMSLHERTEIRWVTKKELKKMNLRSNVLFYATEALKELGE
ncbi:NUDIX hydrolase [Candidatus Nomurabacteria bacterium CG_4_9_14_0_2_um_filter_32_10]|uniref:NUDIX hydrolase n=3 Tax=Candidatus Nomuraibacteriota TaxID=1752729 RepID=A0A2H0CG55_9BACT|nr:MAG: NUDIX hydrolase [Candidatus Nomurabacteria bacterium CG22_combo_CG10-13_8_21_14_all_32_8]PIZ85370.1 MAG: NUDIX hydrolase [Candidatus Nomurabacteria bacterium CG_4_10_14_0_2_um_filter_33_9]PJC49561.1 MAG: NUDIX hydrolase [Candidatus Nomurabacteria bacterium CG_4_9_14_0_2_um_filter_32_10]